LRCRRDQPRPPHHRVNTPKSPSRVPVAPTSRLGPPGPRRPRLPKRSRPCHPPCGHRLPDALVGLTPLCLAVPMRAGTSGVGWDWGTCARLVSPGGALASIVWARWSRRCPRDARPHGAWPTAGGRVARPGVGVLSRRPGHARPGPGGGRSGRNTARATVGGEFPSCSLSVVQRVPHSTVVHVSASPPLIPGSRISRVRWAAIACPQRTFPHRPRLKRSLVYPP
jgi:hypothetical protein